MLEALESVSGERDAAHAEINSKQRQIEEVRVSVRASVRVAVRVSVRVSVHVSVASSSCLL